MNKFLLFTFTILLCGSTAWGQEKAAEVRIADRVAFSENRIKLRADGKQQPDSVVWYDDKENKTVIMSVYEPRFYYNDDIKRWCLPKTHFTSTWTPGNCDVKYNSQGLVESAVYTYDDNNINPLLYQFEYNSNGDLLSYDVFYRPKNNPSSAWIYIMHGIYTYDTYGNWVGYREYDEDNEPYSFIYSAFVDDKGRIIYSVDKAVNNRFFTGNNSQLLYSIWYYPDGRTPNAEIENNTPVDGNNQGSFDLNVNVPADSISTGSITVNLPEGFTLDEENTSLTVDFAGLFDLTITKQENNSWLFEIKPKTLRGASLRADEVQKAIRVAYRVDEEVKRGSYDISVNSILFTTPYGNLIPEPAIIVPAVLNRWATANEDVEAGLKAYARDGQLYVSGLTPGEVWSVYSVTGAIIYQGTADGSEVVIQLPARGIYIIKAGGSTVKVAAVN